MLHQLAIYLLKITCISALLFLYYHIALRNKRFHYYNRFYLLMAVAISTALPFIRLEWFTFFSNSEQTIHLYKIIYDSGENEVVVSGNAPVNPEQIALYALAAASLLMLAVLCIRIIKIEILKKKYPVQRFPGFDFINTDISSAPFSFLKNIFWRNDINLEEETGKQILQHEITHIQQKHSLDKLCMEIVLCFYWMNPFFHLIKRELYLIHEFIADEEAVKHADADAFAKMLLTAQFGKFNFLPAQSIFYSSIKRRLTMLTTSKKPQFSYVRRLLALPLIAALVCLFAFTVKTRNAENHLPAMALSKPFVLVVDAGHGGKDYGASGNGLREKDAALKIAQKIKDLSSQYGIDVILTRNSDVYMNVQEKSNFINEQNADAFISVHVNSAPKIKSKDNPPVDNPASGFEVALSADNEKFAAQNQALGSAILQNISKDFNAAPALQTRNVGIWILKNSNIPAALIECGYITNANDAGNLKDDAKIELMAKNILQGVAMYANNTDDKSNLHQLKNENSKDTTPSSGLILKGNTKPLYVLNGKIISEEEAGKIDTASIQEVSVWKDKAAIEKYGNTGKDGVVEITTKKSSENTLPENALYVLDGKVISKDEMKAIDPGSINSVNILKGKDATDKYGDKGKNGVIEVSLKKTALEWQRNPDNILYVLDGKIISKYEFLRLNRSTIQAVDFPEGKAATDKYGDKAKYGAIEIITKKASSFNTEGTATIAKSDTNFKPVFTDAQVQPKFPGGIEGWKNYLIQNLKADVPAKRKAPPGTYAVTVSFLVDENGEVSDVKALNDPGYGTAVEAVRVIAQGPKWMPAIQNGHNVTFENKQKIAFSVSN